MNEKTAINKGKDAGNENGRVEKEKRDTMKKRKKERKKEKEGMLLMLDCC